MSGALLVCSDVEVRYGPTVALDGLDLTALGGAVTGLVGPNGAGKTTTLRLVAGLVPRARGRVEVLGRDPARHPTEVRRRLGLLPDRPTLPAHLTVEELLLLRAALYGIDRDDAAARLDAMCTELQVEEVRSRWCHALSHGQAQRVALAAVLLPEPPLLLVDEPMTALDLVAQHAVQAALRRRAAAGAAVVVTTHTVGHVAALADRVVSLRRGRVHAERDGTRDAAELEAWLLARSS